ncbi:MAG: pseudouridine synthase [Hydrogenophaga sp.]|jgi:tRNA pseudouridine32 synthase / 23S rRNA pseudouridine746 synthase|nr:pseudouridine synthase [Hydrogenophaga sp.]
MACGTWCSAGSEAASVARQPRNPLIPARQGVSPSCVALPSTKPPPWPTLLDFLAERLHAVGRDDWARRMARGEVLGDDARALPPDAPFQPGARVYYYRELDDETVIPFEEVVVFRDAHLLVVDKPHFLPVTPGGRYVRQSLLVRLKQRLDLPDLSPIHRIDRETAGLVVFSLRPQDRDAYQALFRDRAVHKIYEAIAPHDEAVDWPVLRRSLIVEEAGAFFRMTEAPGEANSETRIERLEARGAWARYRLAPLTGRRHQLRVHMNALGLPIAGDQFYPRVLRGPDEAEDFLNPLRLLAKAIAFTDPVTGEARAFESPRALDWPS